MKLWKYHWDIQLYKALEHQYQRGIVTLNDVMPEFKVDLIYKLVRTANIDFLILNFKVPHHIHCTFIKKFEIKLCF